MSDSLFIYAEDWSIDSMKIRVRKIRLILLLHCGHKYHHTWPAPEDICIEDIAMPYLKSVDLLDISIHSIQ